MAKTFRRIQFKRNSVISSSAQEAKLKFQNLPESALTDGEIVIGTYHTDSRTDSNAKVIGVKANGKIFSIDNQTILDVIGIDDNGNVNSMLTGPTILKSLDEISGKVDTHDEKIDAISGKVDTLDAEIDAVSGNVDTVSGMVVALEEEIEELSGITADDIYELSGKTITVANSTSSVTLTVGNATSDGTKNISADVNLSNVSGNIITLKSDGLYTQVDYDSVTNSLVVNGEKKQLNGGSVIDTIVYDSVTEELVITYHDSVGQTYTIRVPMKDLIEEYKFASEATSDYNVAFKVDRSVSGGTSVQADVTNFDCGEY